ncbi:putative Translation initiation factor eIF-2B subunit epsilon [Paratrimastix pyriformis]|uniref:Translation initiation factor eIF2B subunit epsilon n=1 Tax=Paratrimastix pyriformis TaxID=342808 RepID=A0ABQ8UH58_9EUKA|nr:putative Translation initiation factor eIF-2B subunit epsilon [Paratrimastix pyriformis]
MRSTNVVLSGRLYGYWRNGDCTFRSLFVVRCGGDAALGMHSPRIALAGGECKMSKEKRKLQALVICDTFTEHFDPISLEIPEILFPIANIPLLEYTLEFLSTSEVQDVILATNFHSQALEDYLRTSRWHSAKQKIHVRVVKCGKANFGDTMRFIDEHHVVSGDFVLCVGGVVSNMNLDEVIRLHGARLEADPNSVCTLVFKEMGRALPARPRDADLFVGYEALEQQLLLYQCSTRGTAAAREPVTMGAEHVTHKRPMTIRSDLVFSQIAVCSTDAPGLFTSNYDYQTFQDFVEGALESLLGHRLFVHVLTEEYASGVPSWALYHAVTRDVLCRWAYPLAPDTLITSPGEPPYTYQRTCIYRGQELELSRTCVLGCNTILGNRTASLAKLSMKLLVQAARFVPGTRREPTISRLPLPFLPPPIADRVELHQSHLWEDVEVGAGTVVTGAVICSGARIGANVRIGEGAIIGPEVRIPDGMVVPARVCLTTVHRRPTFGPGAAAETEDEEEGEPEAAATTCKIAFPAGSPVWVWPYSTGSPDVGLVPPELPEPTDEEEDLEEEGEEHIQDIDQRPSSPAAPPCRTTLSWLEWFHEELADTFLRGIHGGHKCENVEVEISGVRFAYDKTALDCGQAMLEAIILDQPPKDTIPALKKLLPKWGPTLAKQFSNENEDQLEAVYTLQSLVEHSPEYQSSFMMLLHTFYNADILSEEAVLQARRPLTPCPPDFLSPPPRQWSREVAQEAADSLEATLLKQVRVRRPFDRTSRGWVAQQLPPGWAPE